jgi:hypothetical protein
LPLFANTGALKESGFLPLNIEEGKLNWNYLKYFKIGGVSIEKVKLELSV